MKNEYYFDEAEAKRVIAFIETFCSHCKGKLSGEPFILEQWQKDEIIIPLFAMKNKKTGLRKYRTCYIEIPRKNGKTSLISCIALYCLFADSERGSEIISAANDRSQASLCFEIARQMVLNNKQLNERAKVFRNSIVYEKKGNYYKAISADAFTKHGMNCNVLIYDELHAAKNQELWDVMTTSQAARDEPLSIAITTAGYDKNSFCYQMNDYANKVKNGIIKDETFLSVIYCAEDKDDWTKVATWKKANPNYGISVNKDYLRQQCEKAKKLPSFENTFKRLHLNIWTTQDVKWIGDDKWMECNLRDIDAERLKGRECWAALDLASVSDLTALVLLFPMDDGTFDILNFNWIPAENAYQRTLKYGIPFDVWIEQGYLYSTDGDVTDYEVIKNKILELSEIYDIKSLSYDRWNSSMLINELMGAGVNVTPYGQGFASMSFPAKQLERWILEKKINHGGNPSLRWQFSNVQIQTDASGNIKPNKAKSKEKIDSIVSLIMSIGDYMNDNQEPTQKTIYNDDNIKFI